MHSRYLRYSFLSVLLLFTILSFSNCGKSPDSASEDDQNVETQLSVLASINGKPVNKTQFDAFLKFKRVPIKDEKRRKKILEQYVEREALASVIENENLLDKALIQAELNEFRKEMLISRYFEKFLKDRVTEQAVQNYYNTHASDYEQRKVHVAHILIRTNKKMGEIERKAKLTTAQEAYSLIRSGKDFKEIAKDYSEDNVSAKKGGDLGWLKEGSIDRRFSETVFAMKPNDVSEPFETTFGFHVVKLIEGPNVVKRPFKAVAGDIRYQLRNKTKKAEVERLKGKSKIVIK